MAKIAVIETGGKQHVVSDGSVITIEKLNETYKKGDKLSFDKVLLVDDGSSVKIGKPYVDGAKVTPTTVPVHGRSFTVEGQKYTW